MRSLLLYPQDSEYLILGLVCHPFIRASRPHSYFLVSDNLVQLLLDPSFHFRDNGKGLWPHISCNPRGSSPVAWEWCPGASLESIMSFCLIAVLALTAFLPA